jgi:very-short-patch-repair endonuclease
VRATGLPGRAVTGNVLIAQVTAAQEILGRWTEIGGRGTPRAPQANGNPSDSYQRLRTRLAQLESLAGCRDLAQLPIAECKLALEALDADGVTLARLPELHRIRLLLDNLGLSGLVGELSAQKASPDFAVRFLRYAYLRSALDRLALEDLQLSVFSPDAQERIVTEFRNGDRAHIAATPGRVRRAHAERLVRAMDADTESAALVKHQAMLKKRHMPTRDFVRNAASVLLAAKPCWAMSPLVVSRLLPAAPIFDVVIFDEASQVTPADAATSILRGRQLVVAGDDKQLPPTAFFASTAPEDESPSDDDEPGSEAEPPLMAGTAGFESILDALAPLLGMKMLTWHYRSRDERLISFSNQHIYDGILTTFPGASADGDQVLRYVPAPYQQGAGTNSPAPEVRTVVDLILEHARECPEKSLGVITMGMAHSNRVEEQLRQRLRNDPELAAELGDFFDEEREERFFVKNIERVQGDERDAIILSIGYGKDANGRLPYRFGPLLSAGGERRLNVAVTRAKSRLTLVSSFSSHDMDPERSSARGVQLLRQYLQYVESGGTNLGDQVRDRIPLNPFEVDVRDMLTKRGLSLTAQYGASGYWIDFAVQDPEQPGHYVLAIECDGASYHSSPSARDRDRLRQEQLERLGWRFHRIWSTDWFRNKEACADAAIEAYERALTADTTPAPVSVTPPDAAPTAATGSATQSGTQPKRDPALNPRCMPGLAIDGYTDTDLRLLARWIKSDGILRTADELMTEMMRELGFQKRGSRIVARLTEAINQAKK